MSSNLYDSPSLYNVEAPSSSHILTKRPTSLKNLFKENIGQKNRECDEEKCLKCKIAFERLSRIEKELKETKKDLSNCQKEINMEREHNEKKIQDMIRHHRQDVEKRMQEAEKSTGCAICVVS